jgi:hypothetical protein
VAFGRPGDSAGRTGMLSYRRRVAGVTAACMLTPMQCSIWWAACAHGSPATTTTSTTA